MQLTPREKDKLLIAMAAEVARKRQSPGVKLNYPEAIALITDFVVESAGWPDSGRYDGSRGHGHHPRSMHGRHCRDDPRCTG